MKRNKQSGFRKTRLVIKANPQFGQRVEKPRKGKGSYKREKTRTADYFAKAFARCFSKIVCQKTGGWREPRKWQSEEGCA